MTKFNPKNKKVLSYGECLEPAMTITEQSDANQYLKSYVDFIQKALDKEPRTDGKSAMNIARINLGYFAGYYEDKIRERVERLFQCSHPIFGSIARKGSPTASEAFEMGKRMGAKLRK